MIVLIHVLCALTSLGSTGYAYWNPSNRKLHVTYVLVAATFVSGFVLLATKPSRMAEVCVIGLLYIGCVSFGIFSARATLARAQVYSDPKQGRTI